MRYLAQQLLVLGTERVSKFGCIYFALFKIQRLLCRILCLTGFWLLAFGFWLLAFGFGLGFDWMLWEIGVRRCVKGEIGASVNRPLYSCCEWFMKPSQELVSPISPIRSCLSVLILPSSLLLSRLHLDSVNTFSICCTQLTTFYSLLLWRFRVGIPVHFFRRLKCICAESVGCGSMAHRLGNRPASTSMPLLCCMTQIPCN